MKIFGSIQELVELVYRKGSNTVTLKPNTAQATSITLSLPVLTGDDTVVTNTSTASFSNKTINLAVGGNTISQMTIGSFGQSVGDADKVLLRDVNGTVQHSKIRDVNVDAVAAIALSKLATVTASRALQSDGSGNISASSITSTELGHLSGVTSNIQTQLNGKEATITILPISKGGTNSSTSLNNNRVMVSSGSAIVEASAITASRALASDASGLPVASATTSTELGYVSGVTSAIQTQINAKADTSALTAHTGASSGVHGVTGSVVGTTDTQVLTNKDIDGGTASNTSRTTLPKANKSVLDGLTRKQATLLYGSDTNKVYADDGSTLKEIGSGSSGINYLNSQFNADALGTVEVSVGDTLASTTRANPNQWGNSAASALITQSTDSTLRGTTNYLVAFSANAQFVESPLFSIDGQDLSKPLLVQFDVSGVVTADDVQVYIARYNSSNVLQERIPVAGTASATTPFSARVPTNVTTFKGFFITSSTATDKYAVRWLRNANNTSMRLDTFFVGPQSLAQGAVITQWQSYTPTLTNFGSKGTNVNTAFWRRNGSDIEIIFTYNGNSTASGAGSSSLQWSLPSGLTFDTTKLPNGSFSDDNYVGSAKDYNVTNAQYSYANQIVPVTSTTFSIVRGGTNSYYTTDSINIARNAYFSGQLKAPISQWSSGTTTLADRAVEEYASNDGSGGVATGTAYDTGMVYGSSGSAIPNVTKNSALNDSTTRYKVRFTTPILPTDSLFLEISTDRVNWTPLTTQNGATYYNAAGTRISSVTGFSYQNAKTYGIGINNTPINSTDIYVLFGNTGPFNDTTYGGATTATWPTTQYWRVRKVSGGAAVGYPVSARNIVGDTSGTAVPSGYVGEVKSAIQSSNIAITTGTNWTNIASVALTPGIWSVHMHATASSTTPGASYNEGTRLGYSIDSSTGFSDLDGTIARANTTLFSSTAPVTSSINQQRFAASSQCVPIVVTSNTTYYLKVSNNVASGQLDIAAGRLIFIRIA